MAPWPTFIGPSYTPASVVIDSQRLVNEILERVDSGQGKGPACLLGRPGLKPFVQNLPGAPRVLFWQDGRAFCVAGSRFCEVFINGTFTDFGAVLPDGALGTICSNGIDNGHQLLITSGGGGSIFDLNQNTLTAITAPSFLPGVTMGVYVDGYFVVLSRNTNTIALSALEDGLSWSGIDHAQRVASSDRMTALVEDHKTLWMPGTERTEVWYNSGASNFPLEPIQGSFFENGAIPWSVCRFDNTIAWLSQNARGGRMVYRAEGYTPKRISDHGLETILSRYPTVQDAEAFTQEYVGHTFYVLNFPAAQATWVYDAATGTWAERDWWNAATGRYEAARPRCHCYGFDQHLVGDRELPIIYTESFDTFDDNGVAIHRRRRAPHLCDEKVRHFYHRLEFDMLVGEGIAGDATRTPLVTLRYSNDGGRTWSRDRTTSLGLQGEYGTRVHFDQLGSGRDRVFEREISEPVRVVTTAAYLRATKGVH